MVANYFNILEEATHNPKFIAELDKILAEIEHFQGLGAMGKVKLDDALTRFLRLCQYNTGLLVGHCFPRFDGAEPLSLSRRPFAFPIYDMLPFGSMTLRAGRQVSKSSNLCCRFMMLTRILTGWSALYIAPHREHAKTFADKFQQIEAGFIYKQRAGRGVKLRDNLYYKRIEATECILEIQNALTTAAHIRGKTCDEVAFDEYQLFDPDLEGDIMSVQKTSKMPTTSYSGTSTTVDSPLEIRFQESSQGYWMIESPHLSGAKRWIHCGDQVQVLKMISPSGPVCPTTGKPIDTLRGKFVFEQPSALEYSRVGFHIPQFIVPDFVKPAKWSAEIYNFLKKYGEKKFLQEIAGIALEDGFRELTRAQMTDLCTLRLSEPERIKAATSGKYRWVISACDWGGSDHQMYRGSKTSYTQHTILGVPTNGPLDILHMRRHFGMAYEDIGNTILADHHRFNAFALASDYGAGAFYNTYLHKYLPANRHFVFGYGSPYLPMLKKPEHQFFPLHFTLNKTESISQLFDRVRHGQFRCYDWEEASTFLEEFLNVMRIPSERLHGQQFFRYIRNATKTDDTVHAWNFGNVLARILRGEPVFDNANEEREARLLWGGGLPVSNYQTLSGQSRVVSG